MKNPDCIIQKSSCYNDIPSKKKKKKKKYEILFFYFDSTERESLCQKNISQNKTMKNEFKKNKKKGKRLNSIGESRKSQNIEK